MKKFSYALAALATLAMPAPAVAQAKPMMKTDDMAIHDRIERHHHNMVM